ncbi:MAG: DUF4118 domain-containing protein [Acidimicrobiales bacterium]
MTRADASVSDALHHDDLLAVALGALAPLPVAVVLTALPGGRPDTVVTVLVLVGVVVLAAGMGGRRAGAASALVAGLSYDFFFLEPYLSLHIHAVSDVVAFVLLLAVGLLVGQVAGRSRHRQDVVDEQRTGIRVVHHLAEQLAGGASRAELREAAARALVDHMDLASCTWREDDPGLVTRVGRAGTLDLPHYRLAAHGFEVPSDGLALVASHAGEDLGWFHVHGRPGIGVTKEQWLTAVTVVDLVAAAPEPAPRLR